MNLSKKFAYAVVPFVLVLASCATTNKSISSATNTTPDTQTVAAQGSEIEVFAASNAAIYGYLPVRLNNRWAVYISPQPVINTSHVQGIDIAKSSKGRTYVKLNLSPEGVAMINRVPANQGFATTVGRQLVSLTGVRQGTNFLINVRDQQVATSIVEAIVPKRARP